MPNFAIRVELRGNPTREQYDTLHALMARKGFLQTVDGVDSQGKAKRFALPHATYYGASTASCGAVRDDVGAAIRAQIQNDIIVFVVQAETWALG
jgi:hypothetical protein